MEDEKKIVIFSVKSIYDNPLLETGQLSIFEKEIQAGAALTDRRIAEINDYDGAEDSISDQNRRYSELSVMYWAWKNCNYDYIGISHYRRKFDVADEVLEQYCQEDVDVIILKAEILEKPLEQLYTDYHYTYDWVYITELIHEVDEGFYRFIVEQKHENLHPACMAIYQRKYMEEVCQFLFPILARFCQERPEKRDLYQRRDAGFLGERLLSLYFEYRKQNLNYREVGLRELKSQHFLTLGQPEVKKDVRRYLDQLVREGNWTKCCKLIFDIDEKQYDEDVEVMRNLVLLFLQERRQEKETFFDYVESVESMEDLIGFYREMARKIQSLIQMGLTQENLTDFLRKNRITQTGVLKIMEMELA